MIPSSNGLGCPASRPEDVGSSPAGITKFLGGDVMDGNGCWGAISFKLVKCTVCQSDREKPGVEFSLDCFHSKNEVNKSSASICLDCFLSNTIRIVQNGGSDNEIAA